MQEQIIPTIAGGNTEAENMQNITQAMVNVNYPVDEFIEEEITDRKMTEKQGREIAIRFKAGTNQPLTPTLMDEYYTKYKGDPLKLADIYDYKTTLSEA